MDLRRTFLGFLIGAVVGNIVGFTFRFLARHWLASSVIAAVLMYGYKHSDLKREWDATQRAEEIMKGTPSEEQVAEAEERGEEAKPEPKVTVSNVTVIPDYDVYAYERGKRFKAVTVDVTNTGPFAVKDIGLNCGFRRVGDDPRDPPIRSNTDHRQFLVLKPGETKRLTYAYQDLVGRDIIPSSVTCTPWWITVERTQALKAAGMDDITNHVTANLSTGVRFDRKDRKDWEVLTLSGEVTNTTPDRFVRNVNIECEIVESADSAWPERTHRSPLVHIDVGPGETKQFPRMDIIRFETWKGRSKHDVTCRMERAYEEDADRRQKRLAEEAAEREKLAKMTPLERKRYRESSQTPWGRVQSLWR